MLRADIGRSLVLAVNSEMAVFLLVALFCIVGSTSARVVRKPFALAETGKLSNELRALHEEKSEVIENEVIDCAVTDDLTPVCGTDGVTYDNPSEARCSGVAVAHYGPCPGSDVEFPVVPEPKSKRSNAKTKKTSPNCTMTADYTPVCGMDGITYANPSHARCNNVSVAYKGACNETTIHRSHVKGLKEKKNHGSAMSVSLGKRSPDISFPDFPDINIPDINIPDINIPDINIPDINIPDINIPDIDFPNFYPKKKVNKKKNIHQYSGKQSRDLSISFPDFPDINVPDINIPYINIPDINIPDINIPDINIPDINIPDINIPDITIPDMPDINFPSINFPELHARHFIRKKTETKRKKKANKHKLY